MIKLGLKLGSTNIQYTNEILDYYENGVFQYIELFVPTGTFSDTIDYWKQFNIPFGIHAPHSAAGLNLSLIKNRQINKEKIEEAIRFTDSLKAKYLVFHSGTNGTCDEVVNQLKPYVDERFLIENKPVNGLDGSRCIGTNIDELQYILKSLNVGFVLDFGHAICAANTYKVNPINFIKKLNNLKPRLYHLTDGNYTSELDSHLHYGKGSFPLKQLLDFVPENGMVTNEAKRDNPFSLKEFFNDSKYILRRYNK